MCLFRFLHSLPLYRRPHVRVLQTTRARHHHHHHLPTYQNPPRDSRESCQIIINMSSRIVLISNFPTVFYFNYWRRKWSAGQDGQGGRAGPNRMTSVSPFTFFLGLGAVTVRSIRKPTACPSLIIRLRLSLTFSLHHHSLSSFLLPSFLLLSLSTQKKKKKKFKNEKETQVPTRSS